MRTTNSSNRSYSNVCKNVRTNLQVKFDMNKSRSTNYNVNDTRSTVETKCPGLLVKLHSVAKQYLAKQNQAN